MIREWFVLWPSARKGRRLWIETPGTIPWRATTRLGRKRWSGFATQRAFHMRFKMTGLCLSIFLALLPTATGRDHGVSFHARLTPKRSHSFDLPFWRQRFQLKLSWPRKRPVGSHVPMSLPTGGERVWSYYILRRDSSARGDRQPAARRSRFERPPRNGQRRLADAVQIAPRSWIGRINPSVATAV